MAGNPLADWLDAGDAPPPDADDDERPRHGRPRQRRARPAVVVAAVVWLAAATAVVLTRDSGQDPPDGSSEAVEVTGAQGGAAPDAAGVAGDGAGTVGDPARAAEGSAGTVADVGAEGGAPLEAAPPVDAAGAAGEVPSDLAAAAVVGVRLEVSRLSPGDQPRYVDVAVAEGVEDAGEDGALSVVRVLAVVLEGDRDGWTDTLVQRFGVPLSTAPGSEPALAGRPWVLPGDAPAGDGGPEWTEVEDQPAGTVAALESAGFSSVDDLTAAESPGGSLLRVTFEAASPAGTHEVWLASRPEPRVLGASARTTD